MTTNPTQPEPISAVDVSREAVTQLARDCDMWSKTFGDKVEHRDVLLALRDALDKAATDYELLSCDYKDLVEEKAHLRATIARQQRAIERKDAELIECRQVMMFQDSIEPNYGWADFVEQHITPAIAYTGDQP